MVQVPQSRWRGLYRGWTEGAGDLASRLFGIEMERREGMVSPQIWCFTAGAPEADTLARFTLLTRMGNLGWIIVPVAVEEFEYLPEMEEHASL